MPTVTLRPDATSVANGSVTGAATHHQALSDNSDGSWCVTAVGGFYRVAFNSFTLPANAVVRSIQPRARGRSTNAIPTTIYSTLYLNGAMYSVVSDQTTGPLTFPDTTIRDVNALAVTPAASQADIDGIEFSFYQGILSSYANVMEAYVDVLYASPPTGTTTGPSGAQGNFTPTASWTHSPGADAVTGETHYRLRVFSAAQYGAGGFDPATAASTYDTGDVAGSATSLVIPNGYLANGGSYRAYARTAQVTNGVVQWTAYSAGPNFNIAATVPVPTSLTPANGATVTGSRPNVSASADATGVPGMTVRREWQFATNNIFTTGVITITEPVGALAATKSGAYPFPSLPTRLTQGTWYLRARSIDQAGVASSYTGTNTITVAHQPSTSSRTPGGGQTLLYGSTVQVNWAFTDPDAEDFQTKYRVQMWRTSDPATILDSTLLTSAAQFHVLTIPGTGWKDVELRWKVLVHDQDNVASAYSSEQTLFLSDNPVVTITSPATAAVITVSAPTITWGHTASLGRIQAQYKVEIWNLTPTPDVLVSSSGWQLGTATSWTPPSPVVEVGPNYHVIVSIIDSAGLAGSDTNTFTASYPAVTVPITALDNTLYPAQAKIHLDWSGSVVDATFYSWRIYRRLVGAASWTRLAEIGASATKVYDDYTCPSQAPVEYAVVQVAILFSAQVESVYVPLPSTATLSNYMLTCQVNPALNVTLWHVNDDSFEEEQEQATINLLGRGRRFEYGTVYGVTGSVTCSLRNIDGGATARAQRLAINALRESGNQIYLLNPFGDVYPVGLAALSVSRTAGVGLHEMTTVTIGYTEVGDES